MKFKNMHEAEDYVNETIDKSLLLYYIKHIEFDEEYDYDEIDEDEDGPGNYYGGWNDALKRVKKFVDKIPTFKAHLDEMSIVKFEVPEATWTYVGDCLWNKYRLANPFLCSNCKSFSEKKYKYCVECWSKMLNGDEDE